jgi:hypothetical protein
MKLKLFLIIALTVSFSYSYSQQINFEWNKIIGNTGHTTGLSIKCDSLGFIYASGTFEGIINYNGTILNSQTGKDGYLFKLDSMGNLIWSKQFSSKYDVEINSIAIDRNNNIIILGDYRVRVNFDTVLKTNNKDTIFSSNMFVSKYDPNGNLLWAKNTAGISYKGNSVAVDLNNNILISGKNVSIIYFDTLAAVNTLDSIYNPYPVPHWEYSQPEIGFIAKYDQNGNKIWIKKTDGSSYKIISDYENNIIVTGNFYSTTSFDGSIISPIGFQTAYLAKYTPNGILIWVKLSGGSAENCGYGLEVDSANNIYQSGQLAGNDVEFGGIIVSTFAATDAFLSKYDRFGNLSWYNIIGSPKTMTDEHYNFNCGNALEIAKNGDILLLGYFLDNLTFGTTTIMSDGAFDLMLLKYNSNGTVIAAAQYSDFGWVEGNDLSIGNNNDFYLTGYTTMSSAISYDPSYSFIGKLNETVLNIQENNESHSIIIYPNPLTSQITIAIDEEQNHANVTIMDLVGKEIKTINFSGKQLTIERGELSNGIYFLQITDEKKNIVIKKIIVQ